MLNDEVLEAPVNQHTLTLRYTARAVEFIRANQGRPFFLYFPHTFPHTPSYASEEFEGRSPHGLYADTVEEIDWSVGTILATLDELGIDENTLVVFTSDNGPRVSGIGRKGNRFGERGGGGSAGPLRGHKGTTWEGGMRVPAIFRWPDRIPASRTTGRVASVLDLLPTFAELAGADQPEDRVIDGRSLAQTLASEGQAGVEPLFCYYFGAQLQAVRHGRWKLFLEIEEYPEKPASIWYTDNDALFKRHYRLQPEPRLYDLEADIGESRDLATEHPETVNRLTRMARQFDASLQADLQD
jgi:arylsulfatase A-like enzyme